MQPLPHVLNQMPGRQPTDLVFLKGSRSLVYLIHGITGTPTEMVFVAAGLARQGFDVYATTLPGHCRRMRDLALSNESQWRAHVCRQLTYARENYDAVFALGLSAGALLTLDAATLVDLKGIGVLSPTFFYDGWNTPWSQRILAPAMRWVPAPLQRVLFHMDGPPFGIKNPSLQAQICAAYNPRAVFQEWLSAWWPWSAPTSKESHAASMSTSNGNPLFPLSALTEIDRLMVRVRQALGSITIPTLILQAKDDDMTSPRNATFVYDSIGSAVKKIILLDNCYHVITVDFERKSVVRHLSEFFHGLA